MLDKQISVQQNDANWDELVALAHDQGVEVIIMQGEHPLVKIVAAEPPAAPMQERILGAHPGAWMSDDFDAPLPDDFWLGKDA
ncbi:MAG: toxin-antitoxin (TA) system antitoxin [Anaerolineae bacterium]|nr:toxin-antitoxin (TA) system antitoxin [Anaerolineae bacterium]